MRHMNNVKNVWRTLVVWMLVVTIFMSVMTTGLTENVNASDTVPIMATIVKAPTVIAETSDVLIRVSATATNLKWTREYNVVLTVPGYPKEAYFVKKVKLSSMQKTATVVFKDIRPIGVGKLIANITPTYSDDVLAQTSTDVHYVNVTVTPSTVMAGFRTVISVETNAPYGYYWYLTTDVSGQNPNGWENTPTFDTAIVPPEDYIGEAEIILHKYVNGKNIIVGKGTVNVVKPTLYLRRNGKELKVTMEGHYYFTEHEKGAINWIHGKLVGYDGYSFVAIDIREKNGKLVGGSFVKPDGTFDIMYVSEAEEVYMYYFNYSFPPRNRLIAVIHQYPDKTAPTINDILITGEHKEKKQHNVYYVGTKQPSWSAVMEIEDNAGIKSVTAYVDGQPFSQTDYTKIRQYGKYDHLFKRKRTYTFTLYKEQAKTYGAKLNSVTVWFVIEDIHGNKKSSPMFIIDYTYFEDKTTPEATVYVPQALSANKIFRKHSKQGNALIEASTIVDMQPIKVSATKTDIGHAEIFRKIVIDNWNSDTYPLKLVASDNHSKHVTIIAGINGLPYYSMDTIDVKVQLVKGKNIIPVILTDRDGNKMLIHIIINRV